jgi:hypothetical protein
MSMASSIWGTADLIVVVMLISYLVNIRKPAAIARYRDKRPLSPHIVPDNAPLNPDSPSGCAARMSCLPTVPPYSLMWLACNSISLVRNR